MTPLRLVAASAVALAGLVGCSGPGPAPFQQPVPGAQSVTDWIAEEPIQPGGFADELTPEQIMESMVLQEQGTLPGSNTVTQREDADGGAVIGYLRTALPQSDHPLRAQDTRLRMEPDGDGWRIASLERRFHCATPEPSTDFCQ